MIIAVCDPKGIAIVNLRKILLHDRAFSNHISRIYEFWDMEQLLDASRDISFDCIVFANCNCLPNVSMCGLLCGYSCFPLIEHYHMHTLFVRDIFYWETARTLWGQYLKLLSVEEKKVKKAIREILDDYGKKECDIIYLESQNHCVFVHLKDVSQLPEGTPSFYATLDETERQFKSLGFLRIHKSYLVNGDYVSRMSNYRVHLNNGMILRGSRKYFSKARELFYQSRLVT